MSALPLIDISPLVRADAVSGDRDGAIAACAAAIDRACRESGFFRVSGHAVPPELQVRLDTLSRQFFALPDAEKQRIAMPLAGSAWRGWFPVGGELTSGKPDAKEGLYFGQELPANDPRVLAGTPLHGANQFPSEPADLRACVLEWFAHMERVGRALLGGIALALGMDAGWFAATIAAQPTHLFRIFHYPPSDGVGWGVGQHTDYGLLTILAQDDCGGLQVQMPACGGRDEQWISVPAEPNVFIVNLGDMLEKLTQGRYRSTLHRVQNSSGRDRLSFPFFVDPSWTATVQALPLDGAPPSDDVSRRWDDASVHVWSGVYGDYLAAKVARVFPDLFQRTVQSAPEAV